MTVEHRQSQLFKIDAALDAWTSKLLRAAVVISKLRARKKRLLKGPSKKGYTEMPLTGIGGGAVEGLDDSLEGL
jgi:hypothetical protein